MPASCHPKQMPQGAITPAAPGSCSVAVAVAPRFVRYSAAVRYTALGSCMLALYRATRLYWPACAAQGQTLHRWHCTEQSVCACVGLAAPQEEVATNPFLRCGEPAIASWCGLSSSHGQPAQVLAELRRRKDHLTVGSSMQSYVIGAIQSIPPLARWAGLHQ